MKISLIAAMAHGRVMGRNNDLPWHLPADLRHFKQLTLGKPVVMGRKTFESLKHPLSERQNIILTHQPGYPAPGCTLASSLSDAISAAGHASELMIIGGATLYAQTLPIADRLYLTYIDADIPGDTYFPEYADNQWIEVSREPHVSDAKNPYNYQFITLDKRN